ncbi:fatty acid desaturase family protein [Solirhodobacter olei]|uniref:fatty acid desaturase family protein n=1 Tax=Solirhodobacter olei TaxID=2493082 RepID=UPI000FDBB722|nr:fatty acid desaturase [Solirhodobacter olei]
MTDHRLRRDHMRDFKTLGRQGRAAAIAIVAGYVLQVFAAILAGSWLLELPGTPLTFAGVAVVVFFLGTRLRGFNNIVHECSHASFTEARGDNRLLGAFCASMTLGCFADYRDGHMTHHAHLGDLDRDEDLRAIRRLHLEDPLTPATVLRHVLTPIVGLNLPYYLKINLSSRDGRAFLVLKFAILAGGVLFLALNPLAALVLFWLPIFWMFPAINYWTDCIDHGGLFENGSELESSRNMVVPKALRAILFPRNDCFHLVHHLFPQVPSQHLEACHRKLMADSAYRQVNTEPRPHVEPVRGLRHGQA